jgi:signal transduction histidine kinase
MQRIYGTIFFVGCILTIGGHAECAQPAGLSPVQSTVTQVVDQATNDALQELPGSTGQRRSELLFQLARARSLKPADRIEYAGQLRKHGFSRAEPVYAAIAEAETMIEQGRVSLATERLNHAIAIVDAGTGIYHRDLLMLALSRKAHLLEEHDQDEACLAALRLLRLADLTSSIHHRVQSRVILGRIAAANGDQETAITYFEPAMYNAWKGTNSDDTGPLFIELAEYLLSRGVTERSESLAGQVIESDETDKELLFQARMIQAETLLVAGKADAAELACREILTDSGLPQTDTAGLVVRELLGRVLLSLARPEEALQLSVESADRTDVAPALAARLLAVRCQALVDLNRDAEALAHLERAPQLPLEGSQLIELAAIVVELLDLKQQILARQGDYEGAWNASIQSAQLLKDRVDQVQAWRLRLSMLRASINNDEEKDRGQLELLPRTVDNTINSLLVPDGADIRTAGDEENRPTKMGTALSQYQFPTAEEITAAAQTKLRDRAAQQSRFTNNSFLMVLTVCLLVGVLYTTMNSSRKLAMQKRAAAEEMRELEHRMNEKLQVDLAERTRQLESELHHRERMERALEQTRKAEAIARLTSGVAHDFNNLMTVVIASNEVLKVRGRNQLDPGLLQTLSDSTQAARSAADITQQLLAFSRRQPLRPRDVRVDSFVRQVSGLLRRTLGDRISFEVSVECPQMALRIDTAQLTTALINLCANARDAISGTGRVVVTVAHEVLDCGTQNWGGLPDGDYIVISVADNGAGMTEEQCRHATEPFFSTKNEDSSVAGVGLGLSVVDGFLRQSGGLLRIESEPGLGTEVSCVIPVADAHTLADEEAYGTPMELHEQRILIVDDDVPVRRAIEGSLAAHGFQTWTAASPEEATQLLESGLQPRLVLTDVRMRGESSGVEFAKWLREHHPDVRVVLMTGFADQVTSAGFDVISKPFQIADLVQRLEVAA